MAIAGRLRELSVEDVLQLMEMSRKTGVLTVRSERHDDEVRMHLEQGALVHAARKRSKRRLGQQLLRAGKLTERELERALDEQRRGAGRLLGELLVELGSIDEDELERQLRFQLEETVYDLMAWEQGRFRFEAREEVGSDGLSIRVRAQSLLMEGARRIDEWERLAPKVTSPESVPVLAPVERDDGAPPLDLRPEEWEVLAEIDGERDLRRIAGEVGRSSFDVGKIVYGLVSTSVVEMRERPVRLPERELEAAVRELERRFDAGETGAVARRAGELQQTAPEHARLALLAGRALAAEGRMRAATEELARAARLDPLLTEAQHRLGFAAARIGELARAIRAWRAFLRLAERNGGPQDAEPGTASDVREAVRAAEALHQVVEEEGRAP